MGLDTPTGPRAPEAPRLSLVVLSGDPDQGYFVDGSTQDMTTDLAWLPGGIVIARNSGFTCKDKTVDPKQAGSEPGLRCVLEGSVGRIRNEVRVNALADRC